MADDRLERATAEACTEIDLVWNGLDGMLGLIADGPSKEIRMKRDSLYFAMEPHVKRLKVALDDLNTVRKAVRDGAA